ncbi:hypothetical protein BCR33DRAFT_716719, partial [Rhizoclosmatium globosum]
LPTRSQLEQLQRRWRQTSGPRALPPINTMDYQNDPLHPLHQQQLHQSKEGAVADIPTSEAPRIKNTVRVAPPDYVEPVNRGKEKTGISINQHNSQAALVGLMETRGLSERIAGMERFIMAEMERIKDSQLTSTQSQLQQIQLTPAPLPPPPPPPPPTLTPSDILTLLQPFLQRLDATASAIDQLDSRLTQLELTTSATTNETRLILRQLASTSKTPKPNKTPTTATTNQWTEQHVALMIQAKVQEAVLGIDREITGVQEGVVMKLEREKEALSGLVEALEKRNLRMLLDGVMGVKQAMMQLGKGTADKKIHDEYLQELKAVKDDLLADLRDAKMNFRGNCKQKN